MAATLTRGAVILAPSLLLPSRLTRASRSVVHEIINDPTPDVTIRAQASRAGDMRLIFATPAAAKAASDALAQPGGPWTVTGTDDQDGAWLVVGDGSCEPTADAMRSRLVTITVREVLA